MTTLYEPHLDPPAGTPPEPPFGTPAAETLTAPVTPQVDTGAAADPGPADLVEQAIADPATDVPRVLSSRSIDDSAAMLGSAVAALAFMWVAFENLLPWTGVIAFFVCWWIAFMACYAGVSALGNPGPIVVSRLAAAVVASGAALIGATLIWVVSFVFMRGWPALKHPNFYTEDMAGVRPTASLNEGGVLHAIVGSGIQIGIATAISLPLGIGTAIYIAEVGGRAAKTTRTVVEAMTALPDILAGLFVYAFLIIGLGWERNGLAASLALAVTMIPIIARSAEVVLRVVPSGLREAGLALGASKWQTTWRVVLPTARSGLATSLILGVARIAGETAPLLIVSGATTFFNSNPLQYPMNSLPLFIFSAVRSGQPQYIARGYGAAALLLALVLVLFALTRFLARDKVRAR